MYIYAYTRCDAYAPRGAWNKMYSISQHVRQQSVFVCLSVETVLKDSSECLREIFPSFGGASLVLMLACSFCCSVKQQTGLIQRTWLHNYTTYWVDITQRTGLTTYWADTMHWVDTTHWFDTTHWADTMHWVDTTYWVDNVLG